MENKTLIVVAMHDGLSTAIIAGASRFSNVNDVVDLPLDNRMTLNEFQNAFIDALRNHDNVLVLTDILAGACTMALFQLLKTYSFALVSGVNLTMLLEAIDHKEKMDCYELAEHIRQAGIEDIQILNKICEEL